MLTYAIPEAALPRDACTCRDVVPRPRLAQNPLCAACTAWEEGYVLIDGDVRYLRSLWVQANRPDNGDEFACLL